MAFVKVYMYLPATTYVIVSVYVSMYEMRIVALSNSTDPFLSLSLSHTHVEKLTPVQLV